MAALALLTGALLPPLRQTGGAAASRTVAAGVRRSIEDPLSVARARGEHEIRRALPGLEARDRQRIKIGERGQTTVEHRTRWSGRNKHVSHSGEIEACFLCAGTEHRLRGGLGAHRGSSGRADGLQLDTAVRGWVAPVRLTARESAQASVGAVRATTTGAASLTVGAELEGKAKLRVSSAEQELDLRAGAVAGIRARAEQRAAVRFAGLALRETAGAEAWIGAGATGEVRIRHARGSYTLASRAGGALGVGGAFDASLTVDAQELLRQNGRRQTLTLLGASAPPLAVLTPMYTLARRMSR